MIMDIPGEIDRKSLFSMIKKTVSDIQNPAVYYISKYLICVLDKKNIEKNDLETYKEWTIAKFIKEKKGEKNYIAIFSIENSLFVFVKDKNEFKILNDYTANFESLIPLIETYKEFEFYYIEDETEDGIEFNVLIDRLNGFYRDEYVEFTKIKTEIIESDKEKLIENSSFFAKTADFFEKKKEEGLFKQTKLVYILVGGLSVGLLLYGYSEMKKKEALEEMVKHSKPLNVIRPQIKQLKEENKIFFDNTNILSNSNKYQAISPILKEDNFVSISLSDTFVSGIVINKEENVFFEKKIITNISKSQKDISTKDFISKLNEFDLNLSIQENKVFFSEEMTIDKIANLLKSLASSNDYTYELSIVKMDKNDNKAFVNFYGRK